MTVGAFPWRCPNVVVSGGLFTKLLILAVGALFLGLRVMPSLKMRGAFRQVGVLATPGFRVILFSIGGLATFQAIRLLLLCA